jgi:hypothetical protein
MYLLCLGKGRERGRREEGERGRGQIENRLLISR